MVAWQTGLMLVDEINGWEMEDDTERKARRLDLIRTYVGKLRPRGLSDAAFLLDYLDEKSSELERLTREVAVLREYLLWLVELNQEDQIELRQRVSLQDIIDKAYQLLESTTHE